MQKILIVRVSSLGDVVHNMPAIADVRRRYPDAQIDWLVEESFRELVSLVRGVRRAIPFSLRRWRKRLLSPANWREIGAFRRALAAEKYDLVIDCQGLIKTAWVASWAQGPLVGLGNRTEGAGYEWPVRFFYDRAVRIAPHTHVVERTRQLVAAALDEAVFRAPGGANGAADNAGFAVTSGGAALPAPDAVSNAPDTRGFAAATRGAASFAPDAASNVPDVRGFASSPDEAVFPPADVPTDTTDAGKGAVAAGKATPATGAAIGTTGSAEFAVAAPTQNETALPAADLTTYPASAIDFGLDTQRAARALADAGLALRAPYVVFVHATSRADKEWPVAHWVALGRSLMQRGMTLVLPWGSAAERATSERLAHEFGAAAFVPPRLSLPAVVGLIDGAAATVGVDTGLVHIAAALKRPTVELYNFSTAWRTGGYWSPNVVNLGAAGTPPTLAQVRDVLAGFGLL